MSQHFKLADDAYPWLFSWQVAGCCALLYLKPADDAYAWLFQEVSG